MVKRQERRVTKLALTMMAAEAGGAPKRRSAPTSKSSSCMMMTGRVEAKHMAPSPEAVADAWAVVERGGDPVRLAEVCRIRADGFDAAGRQRLLACAVALDWVAQFLAILEGQRVEGVHAEH